MSDQANHDSHLQALETLRNSVGPQDQPAHTHGYLSRDEYATLVFYWAGNEHDAAEISGVMGTLANCSWARIADRQLDTAAAVEALCELYPYKVPAWKYLYPDLFKRCAWAVQNVPKEFTAWNRYYLVQWFFLRRARKEEGIEILDKLLDRVAEGGMVGLEAQQVIHAAAKGDGKVSGVKPFAIAMERAIRARAQMMLLGKVQ